MLSKNLILNNKVTVSDTIDVFKHALMTGGVNGFMESYQPHFGQADFVDAWIGAMRAENLDFLFYKLALANNIELEDCTALSLLINEYRLEKGLYALKVHEVRKMNAALTEEGIPYIFLKGLHLSGLLELKVYKRSVDIDLLFHENDLQKSISCLQSLGYRKMPSEANGEFPMLHPTGTQLDVHYELVASSPFIYMSEIKIDKVFRKLEYSNLGEIKLPGMNLEWTMVYLCLHFGINHQYNDFILLYEIQRFISRFEKKINWGIVKGISRLYDLEVVVAMTFSLLGGFAKQGDSYQDFSNELLRSKKEEERVAKFMDHHSLYERLVAGVHNGLQTNDVPKFCANTPKKAKKFKKGNYAWNDGKYF